MISPKVFTRVPSWAIAQLRAVADARQITFGRHLREVLIASLGDPYPPLIPPAPPPRQVTLEDHLELLREQGIDAGA